jgi:hypothetical protein
MRQLTVITLSIIFLFLTSHAQVTTSQYDNARTGANVNETVLTPQNVNAKQFGKLFSYQVDGSVYTQPLYLPNVEIPGKGKRNVVFVATEHNSVYAFDADGNSPNPLWQVNFINRLAGVTSVPTKDISRPCISPEVGITSTPVIDYATGTLYVLVKTKERKGILEYVFVQRLHALAVTTGAEKFGGPVVIRASVPSSGPDNVNGKIEFDPLRENQRAALLLDQGMIYLAWGGHCEASPFYGWVMAYDAQTLMQKAVFNVAPDAKGGGIWLGGTGLAADKDGNVFVPTGNGKFDAVENGRDYGNSVLKLSLDGQNLVVRDYFTPFDQAELDTNDEDIGAGGAILLPELPGKTTPSGSRLLVIAGKGGTIYVINRDRMGKFQEGSDTHAVQTIPSDHRATGAAATWNGNVYHVLSDDPLRSYAVEHGKLNLKAVTAGKFTRPGTTPSVSANGNKDGIVWALDWRGWQPTDPPSVLRAYDATNVAVEIYNSEQNSARDRLSRTLRFAIPTIANGKVFVSCARAVDVYGVLPASPGKK